MIIAVDAMGGDGAPDTVVRGTLEALSRSSARILLVGDERKIRRSLPEGPPPPSVDILHAPQTVEMGEIGPLALRKKKHSSLYVAIDQVAQGKADAVVSAGNSAAIVATATHGLGLVPGLKRPALGVFLPSLGGKIFLADAGAHTESRGLHLAQTLFLATSFLRHEMKIEEPRVGLLNIGTETTKGPKIIRNAAALLEQMSVPFAGFVEPHTLFSGGLDAVICDGFLGNAVLKLLEGVSQVLRHPDLKQWGAVPKTSGPLDWLERMARAELSGAPLLGVARPVIVAHGRSNPKEIANAIVEAERLVLNGGFERMARDSALHERLTALKSLETRWRIIQWKERWKK